MRIIAVKAVENCFDGAFIKEAHFDAPVTERFIQYLGMSGNLEYHPAFPRPFYKVEFVDGCIVKGVEGNTTARLILQRADISASLDKLQHLVNTFSE